MTEERVTLMRCFHSTENMLHTEDFDALVEGDDA